MKHSNKKYVLLAVLPAITLLFFWFTIHGMNNAEHALINLYFEHTTLVEEILSNPDNKENLTAQFAQKVKLDSAGEKALKRSITTQRWLEKMTFSTPHCVNAPRSSDCRVYDEQLVAVAKTRYGKLLLLSSQEPTRESVLSGKAYTTKDKARMALILILEGLALSSLALFIWSKKK